MADCENCGCKIKIERNEKDIQLLWEENNSMKKMITIAMGTVILQGAVFIGGVVMIIIGKVQVHF